jgi:hypothetical protein
MVIATGAGAGSRRAIGITTFYGMLLSTIIGIVFIPPLYAFFQRSREKVYSLLGKNGSKALENKASEEESDDAVQNEKDSEKGE